MRTALVGLAVSSVLLLVGCTPVPPAERTNTPSAPVTTAAPPTPEPTNPATSEPSTPEPTTAEPSPTRTPVTSPTPLPTNSTSLDGAVIEADGLGPIRLGMSLAEAQAHGWVEMMTYCPRWDATPELQERGISLTFVNDRLYEIWVRGFEFSTAQHIRTSDSLAKLQQVYGDDLQREIRDGGGGPLPQWFVVDGEHELLFLMEDPGNDNTIKAILARTHGTDVVEGC